MALEANVCRVWRPLNPSKCTRGSNKEDEWVVEEFRAIEALGTNLWPFSFNDSVQQLRLGAQPWERRGTKNHLNRT